MDIRAVRQVVKSVYTDSTKWADRVNKMKDDQVLAVYMRLKLMGLIKI